MTDDEWVAQNSGMGPKAAEKKGLCGTCGGKQKIWAAFGGVQQVFTCHGCKGTGKAAKK